MAEEGKEQRTKLGELISKAWRDDAFKARLLSDTMTVLKENGILVREGVTVKAVENTGKVFHIIIPPKPSGELSDEDLAKVAGGIASADIVMTGGGPGRESTPFIFSL